MDSYVVEGLTRRHGSIVANDGIDLRIGTGEVFGLLGPNGAGKTTLVRQLVGLLAPDSGRITLFGRPLEGIDPGRYVGYLSQGDTALADVPVAAAIRTTARLRGESRGGSRAICDDLISELDLAAIADRPLGQLSGGQRRLAAFATALAGARPVLVLDKPTTGLDPASRRAVWAALERRRAAHATTVVLVTHNVIEAERVLERVAVLDEGRVIACGTPAELKEAVNHDARLELVWRHEPPRTDPLVAELAALADIQGARWLLTLPVDRARETLGQLTRGAVYDALDDFTLAAPSLEDVYIALGGRARDLERA
jgi:ABC-2 type transport system ATP-binding protein